ncbi:hypothetical protein MKD34_14075 (plasmid) [Cetobacterium somerae]|uniref:hypothetical protein n=1 Tax=Cetobacterium somerae TaxID=188913 RepID=UPI001F0667E7|nr:hypothetical protein [Cetobacterium somerae]UPO99071.1 hypothetical protein MKD34_14075 [Cetobacterium somerae]
MNIFKEQKEEKNKTLAILEDMKKTIEELKKLEKALNERADSLNSNHRRLSEKVETLNIAEIGECIDSNKEKIKTQITEMETAVKGFKTRIEAEADKNISKYAKKVKWLLYAPIIGFIMALSLITYFYFTNVKYIENKTKELVKQNEEIKKQNGLLADRINNVYWILAEDQKFWYDKESKEFFIQDNKWLKDYKQNLLKNKKTSPKN